MSHETSKSLRRRMRDPMFAERFFVGRAIDIGSGSDSLGRQIGYWPLLKSVDEWDIQDGDAQELPGVPDDSYDLVYSSHCLEHVHDHEATTDNWWRVLKPGGFLVVVVPDAQMYERGQWPSRFNADHKRVFTLHVVADLLGLLVEAYQAEPIKVERIIAHFDPSLPTDYDQTQGLAECAIEFIVRKPE